MTYPKSVTGIFYTITSIDKVYKKTVNFFENSHIHNEFGLKQKITYQICSKTANTSIEFQIRNNAAPILSHTLNKARIEFNENNIQTKIRILIPLPRGVDPPISYPIYLHDYLHQICQGILDEVSPSDLAEIYPDYILKELINKKTKRFYTITAVFSISFIASIWNFRNGHNWVGFYLLLFSVTLLLFFYNILRNQTKKYKDLLRTQTSHET